MLAKTPLIQSHPHDADAADRENQRGEVERDRVREEAKNRPVLPTPEEEYDAKNLAVAAHAFMEELRSSGDRNDLLAFTKDVASTAAAYADSRDDPKAATDLADALYILNNLVAETKPKITDKLSEVLHGSARVLAGRHHICRSSKARLEAKKTMKSKPLNAKSLAQAAAVLADELRNTGLADAARAFAGAAWKFAKKTGNRSARGWFILGAENLASAAAGTPHADAGSDILLAAEIVLDAEPHGQSSTSSCLDSVMAFLCREERSTSNPKPAAFNASDRPSWMERFRLAISPAQRLQPVQVTDEANLIGKRQVLYTVALAAPVPLLTSAAALHLFPDGWAVVAGAGVFVWILASGGMCSLSMHTELFWKIRRRGGDHQQDRLNVSRQ